MEVEKRIFQFWTGDNEMSDNRKRALSTLGACTSIPTLFYDRGAIEKSILEEHPLHPGYKYLTSIQKGDYMKFYFMHHFGGGYADIKHFSSRNNWLECFDFINSHDEVDVVGMHEIPGGSPIEEYNTEENLEIVLSNCFFIFRPHSTISTMCYERLLSVMDSKYEELKQHPAEGPYKGGDNYPMTWHALMGEIFHPILVEVHRTNPEKISNMLKPGWMMNMWHR